MSAIDNDGDAVMGNSNENGESDADGEAGADGEDHGNNENGGGENGNGMDHAIAKLTTYITAYLVESHAFMSQLYEDGSLSLRTELKQVMSGTNRTVDFCMYISAETGSWDAVLNLFHPFIERANMTDLSKPDRSRLITRIIGEIAKETWQCLLEDDFIWQSMLASIDDE